jgi:CubicO group peptidase (beta-lactamase class C family)
MRPLTLAAISGLILGFAFSSPASALSDYQAWLEESYPADGPGAAMIVVKDEKVIYRGASGLADMELGVPLTADNVFRIGSITKQFTAAGILLLEEQGKLKVSDDISTYLPDYPMQGHAITIEQLLTHTSGIFNYTNIPDYFDGVAIRKDLSTDELIEVFANLPMNFAPGEAWNYSNSGYVLLGAIIERVSGQTYAEFMQTAIFDKLDLKHSYHGGPQIIPNRAHGYGGAEGDYHNAGYLSMTQPHGAGALLSTVDDLSKWTNALFSGELLSKASVKKMTTDFELNNGEHTGYAYGLGVAERFGEREISHNGGIHGFSTSGTWLPKHKIYAVVLSNNEDSRSPDFLAARAAFDAAGADYPRLEALDPAPETHADYVGVYQIDEQQTREVIVEDGHLYTHRSGGQRLEILAYGDDEFFYPGGFTHLKFDRDRSGRVVAMDMYQGGIDEAERAERVSDMPEDERASVEVSAEIYDLWSGNYELKPGVHLDVRREGNQLFVQLTGQQAFEVFPTSYRRFFLKAVEAELEFTAGDDGRGATVVLYQGGGEQTAKRVD